MAIYSLYGLDLQVAYDVFGNEINIAYDVFGNIIYTKTPLPDIPILSGDLYSSSVILLPDLYEPNRGFTCTGLTYDKETDTFLIGDIKELQPGGTPSGDSQIVRVTSDFSTVVETIPLSVETVQGVTFDRVHNSLWIAAPNEKKIIQVSLTGTVMSSFSIESPTGVVYSYTDNTLWVLTYSNKIIHCTLSGTIIASFNFAYQETLDQCFLDEKRGYLYITAGTNYSGRNNIYVFDINTHEQRIACTVDSYSVEGLWIGEDGKMVIVNDGYYHSAVVGNNQANIYTLS